jgi:hypothetical protein
LIHLHKCERVLSFLLKNIIIDHFQPMTLYQ